VAVRLNGEWIVRPTFAFSLHVVAGPGTAAAFCFFAAWIEAPLTLG
jgi:hypothetical protein